MGIRKDREKVGRERFAVCIVVKQLYRSTSHALTMFGIAMTQAYNSNTKSFEDLPLSARARSSKGKVRRIIS